MQKITASLLLLVIIFHSTLSAEQLPVKIGVIASLTGKGAQRGESVRQGLELASQQVVERGLLAKDSFQFVYQDVPVNKPALAAAAAHQLIQVAKVTAIIGPMGSSPVGAAAPIIDRAKLPAIVHTASSPTALEGTSYLFRLWPTGRSYARVIAKELSQLGFQEIAMLTAVHDSPVDLRRYLKEELARLNSQVKFVFDEEFATEDGDFRSALTKISRLQPEAIFLNLFEGQIGVAARQARLLGIKSQLFTNAIMSDVELKTAPLALDGIWFPRFIGYTASGRKKFLAKFNAEPANVESAAAAHDAWLVMAEAIAKSGKNPEQIRNYIRDKKQFSGVTGDFRFLANGDATVAIALHQVRDGEIAVQSN